MPTNHPVALYNGPVITTNGLYRISDISFEKASSLVKKQGYTSAVGHQAAAEILSKVLKVNIEQNRIQFKQKIGQKAIALKLNIRPEEGIILNKQQTEEYGYSLKLIERLE